MSGQASPAFNAMVGTILTIISTEYPDDAVAYCASVVPVFPEWEGDEQQNNAAGDIAGHYLGLWVDAWPGYPPMDHGMVFLFERWIKEMGKVNAQDDVLPGVRAQYGDLTANCLQVLVHEFGHALQRNHVLDDLERERQAGTWPRVQQRPVRTGGCGVCPGSYPPKTVLS